MKTKAPKLTVTDRRAVALCESIRQSCQSPGEVYPITVEWIDSRTWGSNPRIMHRGEKCTNISGCGYCKHSACLAEALRDLGETEDQKHQIGRQAGAGVSSVKQALAECGWKLESITGGKKYDVYQISRMPVISTNGAREKCPSCKAKPGAKHSAECTGGNHKLR